MSRNLSFLLPVLMIIGPTGFANADDCDGVLYVGTQDGGAGGGAQVWRYGSGIWTNITPSWNASAVMDLAFYHGRLYAGIQTAHGYGGGSGAGQVWRHSSGTTWTKVSPATNFDQSAMVLEVMDGHLYAGTSSGGNNLGKLYRYDGTSWKAWNGTAWTPQLGSACGYTHGFRAGIVSDICGTNRLYLGDLYHDKFFYFDPNTSELVVMEDHGGSCIWSFAMFQDSIFAGAWSGRVFEMPDTECGTSFPWFSSRSLSGSADNWALAVFQDKLYIGGGDNSAGPSGGKLWVHDGITWPTAPAYTWPSVVGGEGVSALAADGDSALFIGLGLPDGWFYPGDGVGEVWEYDGVNPPGPISGVDQFGGGVQCLLFTDVTQDTDGDDVPDVCDNCPLVPNPGQEDEDEDGGAMVATTARDWPTPTRPIATATASATSVPSATVHRAMSPAKTATRTAFPMLATSPAASRKTVMPTVFLTSVRR